MRQVRTTATLVLILLATVVSGSVLAAGGHGGSGGHRGSGGQGGSGWHGGGSWHGGHFGGSRAHFGVFLGAPLFPYYTAPSYYYPPYYYSPNYYSPNYYYPQAVTDPAYAPAYVERGTVQAAPAPAQANWWYYCADAKGYYPYVRECPGGWVRVSPHPPPS